MSWSLWSSWLVGFFQALKRLNLRSQFEPKKRGVVSCWSFEVLNSLCYVSFKVFCEFRLSHDLSFVCCVSCSSYCETWWPLDWHPPRPSTRHPRHRFPSHHVLLGRHILEGRRSWRGTTVTQVMQGKDQVFFLVHCKYQSLHLQNLEILFEYSILLHVIRWTTQKVQNLGKSLNSLVSGLFPLSH